MTKINNSKSLKTSKKKKRSKKIYFSFTRIFVCLIFSAIVIAGGLIFKTPIENKLNNNVIDTNLSSIDYNGLVVHYIDVGQGDCIALELPDGKKMLIDAGTSKSIEAMTSYINTYVFDKDEEQEVFDYVLLTHSDADHCGGMKSIFDTYQINKVFRPQIYIDSADILKDDYAGTSNKIVSTVTYKNTVNSFYNEPDCEVVFTTIAIINGAQKISGGEGENYYEFVFYTPISKYYTDVNNFSPIMSLSYRGKVFMFTGDAEKENEEELIASGKSLPKVDVLKVGHHGSSTSSSQSFLDKITPKYAVIQVGAGNSYGHPTQATLNRLSSMNATIYRTDENSNVLANVTTNGKLLFGFDAEATTGMVKENKIKVEYLIIFGELVIIYFCFFIKYEKEVA